MECFFSYMWYYQAGMLLSQDIVPEGYAKSIHLILSFFQQGHTFACTGTFFTYLMVGTEPPGYNCLFIKKAILLVHEYQQAKLSSLTLTPLALLSSTLTPSTCPKALKQLQIKLLDLSQRPEDFAMPLWNSNLSNFPLPLLKYIEHLSPSTVLHLIGAQKRRYLFLKLYSLSFPSRRKELLSRAKILYSYLIDVTWDNFRLFNLLKEMSNDPSSPFFSSNLSSFFPKNSEVEVGPKGDSKAVEHDASPSSSSLQTPNRQPEDAKGKSEETKEREPNDSNFASPAGKSREKYFDKGSKSTSPSRLDAFMKMSNSLHLRSFLDSTKIKFFEKSVELEGVLYDYSSVSKDYFPGESVVAEDYSRRGAVKIPVPFSKSPYHLSKITSSSPSILFSLHSLTPLPHPPKPSPSRPREVFEMNFFSHRSYIFPENQNYEQFFYTPGELYRYYLKVLKNAMALAPHQYVKMNVLQWTVAYHLLYDELFTALVIYCPVASALDTVFFLEEKRSADCSSMNTIDFMEIIHWGSVYNDGPGIPTGMKKEMSGRKAMSVDSLRLLYSKVPLPWSTQWLLSSALKFKKRVKKSRNVDSPVFKDAKYSRKVPIGPESPGLHVEAPNGHSLPLSTPGQLPHPLKKTSEKQATKPNEFVPGTEIQDSNQKPQKESAQIKNTHPEDQKSEVETIIEREGYVLESAMVRDYNTEYKDKKPLNPQAFPESSAMEEGHAKFAEGADNQGMGKEEEEESEKNDPMYEKAIDDHWKEKAPLNAEAKRYLTNFLLPSMSYLSAKRAEYSYLGVELEKSTGTRLNSIIEFVGSFEAKIDSFNEMHTPSITPDLPVDVLGRLRSALSNLIPGQTLLVIVGAILLALIMLSLFIVML